MRKKPAQVVFFQHTKKKLEATLEKATEKHVVKGTGEQNKATTISYTILKQGSAKPALSFPSPLRQTTGTLSYRATWKQKQKEGRRENKKENYDSR